MKTVRFLGILAVLCFLFYSGTVYALDSLDARMLPEPDWQNGFTYFYRTYYHVGERVMPVAEYRSLGIPEGAPVTFNFTIKLENKVVYNKEFTDPFYDTGMDFHTMGSELFQIPEGAVGSGQLIITLSTKALRRTASTDFNVIDENYVDLPIPHKPNFSQRSWFWGGDECLGDCVTSKGRCIYTIASDGSATVSKSFIFTYFDDTSVYYPSDLNSCLETSGGYTFYSGCYCDCPRNDQDMSGIYLNQKCAPPNLLFEHYYDYDDQNSERIYESLVSGVPVMLRTRLKTGKDHFVVAVGQRDSGRLNIFDPWDGQLHMIENAVLKIDRITGIYIFSQQ